METTLLDNEWLAAAIPEDFDDIEHGELETLMGFTYDYMRGMRSEDRHMLLSVVWKDAIKLFTTLMNEKGFAKQVNKTFAKRYRRRDYRCEGFFACDITGASGKAHGFDFSYVIEGVTHEGKAVVFRRGARNYTLIFYTRSEFAESNRAVIQSILSSLEVR